MKEKFCIVAVHVEMSDGRRLWLESVPMGWSEARALAESHERMGREARVIEAA